MRLGIFEILTIIFVTLKVSGVGNIANWSWWQVLTPCWGGLIIATIMIINERQGKPRRADFVIEIQKGKE